MEEQNEKQAIEELADDVRRIRESYYGQADYLFAKKLYEDGYRKQIEAVWVARICEFSDGTKMVEEYNCSNCLHEEGDNDKHFCPSCGAKMKGEEDEG